MVNDEARERGWWITKLERTDEGGWDVRVQLVDGSALQLFLGSQDNLDVVIADAVAAHKAHDVRWHKLSEPGGS